jgi:nicotinamidase-related amidase
LAAGAPFVAQLRRLMPLDLASLVAPSHTALVTMEMQRGVIGDLAALPQLAAECEAVGVVAHTAALLAEARRAGVRVVHCTAAFRADRAGSALNSPMLAALAKRPDHLLIGSPAAELVPELGGVGSDLISQRSHGVSPFSGTALDVTLRNLGVTTVVVAGVSLNLGIIGLAVEAVNTGYHVVVATDAVAGYPRSYAESVMAHTIPLIATRAAVAEITACWTAARA